MPVTFVATSVSDAYLRNDTLTTVEDTAARLAPHCPEGIRHTYINTSAGSFRPAVSFSFPAMTEGWVSFYQWAGDMTTNNWGHFMWSLLDVVAAPASPAIGIFKNQNALTFTSHRPNGTGTTTASFAGVTTSLQRWDVYFRLHASTGEILIYLDGTEVFSFSGNTLPTHAGFVGINVLTFQREGGANPSDRAWSGIIVSTTDTRLMELVMDYPTGDGALTDWTGTFADVDGTGLDGATQIIAATAGERSTLTFPTLPGSLPTFTPIAVGIRARGAAGAPVEGICRIGTDVFDMGAVELVPSIGGSGGWAGLAQNPNTVSAWSIAEVEGAQFGLRLDALTP